AQPLPHSFPTRRSSDLGSEYRSCTDQNVPAGGHGLDGCRGSTGAKGDLGDRQPTGHECLGQGIGLGGVVQNYDGYQACLCDSVQEFFGLELFLSTLRCRQPSDYKRLHQWVVSETLTSGNRVNKAYVIACGRRCSANSNAR